MSAAYSRRLWVKCCLTRCSSKISRHLKIPEKGGEVSGATVAKQEFPIAPYIDGMRKGRFRGVTVAKQEFPITPYIDGMRTDFA